MALQDTAGSALKYTNTFVVTTSFADLATVIDQYANNALRDDAERRARRSARPACGWRRPFGFRAGQKLVVDSGANQETVTIAKVLDPAADRQHDAVGGRGGGRDRRSAWRATRRATTGGPNAPTNNGPIVGQPIVLDTGANQEVVTVKQPHLAAARGAGAERRCSARRWPRTTRPGRRRRSRT